MKVYKKWVKSYWCHTFGVFTTQQQTCLHTKTGTGLIWQDETWSIILNHHGERKKGTVKLRVEDA